MPCMLKSNFLSSSPSTGRCVCVLVLVCVCTCGHGCKGKGEKEIRQLKTSLKGFCISEVNHYLLSYSKFC